MTISTDCFLNNIVSVTFRGAYFTHIAQFIKQQLTSRLITNHLSNVCKSWSCIKAASVSGKSLVAVVIHEIGGCFRLKAIYSKGRKLTTAWAWEYRPMVSSCDVWISQHSTGLMRSIEMSVDDLSSL